MSNQYKKFLRLLEKWPVDKTKQGRYEILHILTLASRLLLAHLLLFLGILDNFFATSFSKFSVDQTSLQPTIQSLIRSSSR